MVLSQKAFRCVKPLAHPCHDRSSFRLHRPAEGRSLRQGDAAQAACSSRRTLGHAEDLRRLRSSLQSRRDAMPFMSSPLVWQRRRHDGISRRTTAVGASPKDLSCVMHASQLDNTRSSSGGPASWPPSCSSPWPSRSKAPSALLSRWRESALQDSPGIWHSSRKPSHGSSIGAQSTIEQSDEGYAPPTLLFNVTLLAGRPNP